MYCPTDAARHHFKGLKVIHFRFSEKVLLNEVDEAVLNIHLQDLEPRLNTTFDPKEPFTITIQVSRITRNSQGNKASVPYTDNSVKLTRKDLKLGKWLKVNVTNLVAEFFRMPRENLATVVRVQDSKNRMSLVVPHPSSESNHQLFPPRLMGHKPPFETVKSVKAIVHHAGPKLNFLRRAGFISMLSFTTEQLMRNRKEKQNEMPYIEVSLRDNSHKRTRRTLGLDCTENTKEDRCCRYPLVVNFEEFGWDWIIAPKQYDASYCSGECPYNFLQKYPHTHLALLAAPHGSGGPCCAPRRMSSISMLFFDHELNIIYGTIPGMVVESCGCS